MAYLFTVPLRTLQASAAAISKAAYPDHGWSKRSLAPPDSSIKLHIAVRQEDGGAEITRRLVQASSPGHDCFRQHLSADEVAALSKPAADSLSQVEDWLRQHGMWPAANLSNGMFEVETTKRQAEKLLNASYSVLSEGKNDVVRTELYHLPEDVAEHVDFVTPTTVFPKPEDKQEAVLASRTVPEESLQKRASCGAFDNTTPECLRKVYGIDYTAQPNRTTFAVYATEAFVYNPGDLQRFLDHYNKPAADARPSYRVDGTGDSANGEGGTGAKFETALDTQVLMGLAWPAQGVLYDRGGVFGPNVGQTYDNFLQFLMELRSMLDPPSVVSFAESQPENRFDSDYANRLCIEMAAIGLRGVTLVFSSGNNGANGQDGSSEHNTVFEPKFPASCPRVLAVGGTTNLADEKAATKSTIPPTSRLGFTASGGGFSNYFPVPSWQATHTNSYIDNFVPDGYKTKSGFNAYGAGIPDVSAFSTQFPTFVEGFPVAIPVGGTSGAAPTWAAIITLLNDYQLSRGKPTLGFINPWLYSLKHGLKDITKGGNNAGDCFFLAGCRIGEAPGYDTAAGWDPVTGLGSPKFAELMKALDDPTSSASPP
ncbi:Tripeptidyl-peptidase sed3 [Fulvia fulva]|nr:Tripeptidyl-peptidase sed3 [Fulvia fulva]KAK4610035.1 Tripeptidyl-peptidase sed3 [Fulvia fulva]WPV37427.1 Tripeptidyl-peptidase sed3 [Fulvia fulva]